ncbi:MAG: hypothetical protein NVS4B2_08230 [Chloroflexota bacterium]
MKSSILIIHYTPPGVIGGVEHIIAQHARLLAERGFSVQIVAGRTDSSGGPVQVIPEIDAARPASVALEAELDVGVVPGAFDAARRSIEEQLKPLVEEAEHVIAHNAFTLHFSLPLTAALWSLARERPPDTMIAWCHDLAWTNALYVPAMHPGYPWDLLRRRAPNTRYVTVSFERKQELCTLWEADCDSISVVPNGVDPHSFLALSADTTRIVEDLRVFDRDVVLLLPVRITRRKNIELAIHVVRALKDRQVDVLFLISGPQAPHHPGRSATYLDELKALRTSLHVEHEVIFLADATGLNPTAAMVSELYMVADALFFASAQEGFGLPILEAALRRLPVILSDIPIFREVGGDDVATFGLEEDAGRIAEKILKTLDNAPSRLYRRVLRDYTWQAIADHKILPLLQTDAGGDPTSQVVKT